MSSFKDRREYFEMIASKNKLIGHNQIVTTGGNRLSFFRINNEEELNAACTNWIHFPCVVHAGHNIYFNQPGTGLPQMTIGNHIYFLAKLDKNTYQYDADAIEAAYDIALTALMQFVSYMRNDKQENGCCGEMFLFDLNRAKADQIGPINQVLYGWYLQFMDKEKVKEMEYDEDLWGDVGINPNEPSGGNGGSGGGNSGGGGGNNEPFTRRYNIYDLMQPGETALSHVTITPKFPMYVVGDNPLAPYFIYGGGSIWDDGGVIGIAFSADDYPKLWNAQAFNRTKGLATIASLQGSQQTGYTCEFVGTSQPNYLRGQDLVRYKPTEQEILPCTPHIDLSEYTFVIGEKFYAIFNSEVPLIEFTISSTDVDVNAQMAASHCKIFTCERTTTGCIKFIAPVGSGKYADSKGVTLMIGEQSSLVGGVFTTFGHNIFQNIVPGVDGKLGLHNAANGWFYFKQETYNLTAGQVLTIKIGDELLLTYTILGTEGVDLLAILGAIAGTKVYDSLVFETDGYDMREVAAFIDGVKSIDVIKPYGLHFPYVDDEWMCYPVFGTQGIS